MTGARAAAVTLASALAGACGDQTIAPVDVRTGCPQPPGSVAAPDASSVEVVVSDFERGLSLDGDLATDGAWDVGSDKSDPGFAFEASDACAPSGRHAFHVRAPHGLTNWGMYANLAFRARYAATDLRPYRAIVFWAAVGGADPRPYELLAGFETTTVNAIGGVCTMCGDVYAQRVQVDGRWRRFRIPFASLVQAGWGKPAGLPLALDQVVDLALRADGAFDLWIDRVALERAP